jgi:hypothetical protein
MADSRAGARQAATLAVVEPVAIPQLHFAPFAAMLWLAMPAMHRPISD